MSNWSTQAKSNFQEAKKIRSDPENVPPIACYRVFFAISATAADPMDQKLFMVHVGYVYNALKRSLSLKTSLMFRVLVLKLQTARGAEQTPDMRS